MALPPRYTIYMHSDSYPHFLSLPHLPPPQYSFLGMTRGPSMKRDISDLTRQLGAISARDSFNSHGSGGGGGGHSSLRNSVELHHSTLEMGTSSSSLLNKQSSTRIVRKSMEGKPTAFEEGDSNPRIYTPLCHIYKYCAVPFISHPSSSFSLPFCPRSLLFPSPFSPPFSILFLFYSPPSSFSLSFYQKNKLLQRLRKKKKKRTAGACQWCHCQLPPSSESSLRVSKSVRHC